MVSRRDRVIGVLLVWIAICFGMAMALGRLAQPAINQYNVWYWNFPVVTGADPEQANEVIREMNAVSNDLFYQVQQFANAEILQYAPLILFTGATLLIGALLSTWFIWRSVIVPATRDEGNTLDSKHRFASRSANDEPDIAVVVADDGELIEYEPTRAGSKSR